MKQLVSGWIFIVYFFLSEVKGSQADNAACDRANSEWEESNRKLFVALDSIFPLLGTIMRDPNNTDVTLNASVRAGTFCPGPQFRLTAESSENLIRQCLPTSDVCLGVKPVFYSFTPDVLRAAAQFCENAQMAEYINIARMLAPCQASLVHRGPKSPAAHKPIEPDVFRLAYAEGDAAKENSTASCGLVNGRKYACRMIQIGNPPLTDVSNPHFRDICGRDAQDMVVMLQDRMLNALNCSEFGDFVRDFGGFKVSYQANQAAPVSQQ